MKNEITDEEKYLAKQVLAKVIDAMEYDIKNNYPCSNYTAEQVAVYLLY